MDFTEAITIHDTDIFHLTPIMLNPPTHSQWISPSPQSLSVLRMDSCSYLTHLLSLDAFREGKAHKICILYRINRDTVDTLLPHKQLDMCFLELPMIEA